jgi:hypothetical protein
LRERAGRAEEEKGTGLAGWGKMEEGVHWAENGPKGEGGKLICFLFILIDLMNFALLKLFIELRKFTENSGEYIRAQRILQNIPGQ